MKDAGQALTMVLYVRIPSDEYYELSRRAASSRMSLAMFTRLVLADALRRMADGAYRVDLPLGGPPAAA